MIYLVADQYIGRSLDRYGEFSEPEIELFRQVVQPGHVVLDVGANIGTHTVPLARAVQPDGVVVAFEPQRVLFQMLCANVALNALGNVHARHGAAGREQGSIVVPRLDYSAQDNFGGIELGTWTSGERVPLATLDSLELEACRLIKIDVEGMEGEVIAGGERTIRRCRPLLYVENDRPKRSAALIRQILDLDYRLYWHLPAMFNPNNFFADNENVFGSAISVNMVCVPRESGQDLGALREITSPEDDWRGGP